MLCNLDNLPAMLDHGATAQQLETMGYTLFENKATGVPSMEGAGRVRRPPRAGGKDKQAEDGDASSSDDDDIEEDEAGSSAGENPFVSLGRGRSRLSEPGNIKKNEVIACSLCTCVSLGACWRVSGCVLACLWVRVGMSLGTCWRVVVR